MPTLRTLAVFLVCASLCRADHEVHTLGGKSVTGKVVAITDTEITQQGEDGLVKTPLSQVLLVELRPPGRLSPEINFTLVRLLDDSVLRCNQVAFKGNQVELTLLSGQVATVPLGSLVSLVRDAQDPQLRPKWDALAAAKVKRDRIVILRGGELNPLEGTFGDVDPQGKTIQFRRDTGEIAPVPLDRLHGMLFYRTESPPGTAVCLVQDTQGNFFSASKITVAGDTFHVTTPTGATVSFEEKALARLDYNMGKLTFLSDLEPARPPVEKWGSGLPTPYYKNKNLDGQPIFLKGIPYGKGLSLHAHTELEYVLDGKYKDFKATIGVTPLVDFDMQKIASQALVTIECDGVRVFSETASAQTPRAVALNVRDVRKLRIIVSAQSEPKFLSVHDHATLADARVSQ